MADVTFGNVVIRPAGIDQNVSVMQPSGRDYRSGEKNHPNPPTASFVNTIGSANSPALPGLIFTPAGRLQNHTNSPHRAPGMWIVKTSTSDK
jgi:hypothetical protein